MIKHRLFRYAISISITISIILLILLVLRSILQQNCMNSESIASGLNNTTELCKDAADQFQPSASDYFSIKSTDGREITPLDWLGAAYNGNHWAQCRVGDYYASGSNGFRKNLSKAFRWWNMSAEQGNTVAKIKLVEHYILNYFDMW